MASSARLAAVLVALACALVAASPGPAAGNRNVLSYGDSLSVGTDLFLAGYLRGWNVRSSASISRHADEVPDALRAYGRSLPRVIVALVSVPCAHETRHVFEKSDFLGE